jgi:hypothetical protein
MDDDFDDQDPLEQQEQQDAFVKPVTLTEEIIVSLIINLLLGVNVNLISIRKKLQG